MTIGGDDSIENLNPDLDREINFLTKELFKASRGEVNRNSDAENAKLDNMSTVAMLNEVE